MLFTFVVGGNSICQGAAVDYLPRGVVEELCMVHDAPLLVLQIHTTALEPASGEEWHASSFSVVQLRETLTD
jgi:hypothetical protein